MANSNEILITVDGKAMPCPAAMTWGLQDVSSSESGRTEDTTMHKNRVGQKVKLNLQWNIKKPSEASTILQAFNPEYVNVTYWDAMDGCYETKNFYVGDRSAPMKYWWSGHKYYESISFDIIER